MADTPVGLGPNGSALWVDVTSSFDLRADELRVLEAACFEADLIQVLQSAMVDEPLTVIGSQKQTVINPMISELRQHRSTQAALLRQLHLPDENPSAAGVRSASARTAANARWSQRGA